MKNNIYALLFLFSVIIFTSCEKDVVLDLHSTEPRLVIDASMEAGQICNVYLTTTQDYYDNSFPQRVSGAVISLSDNQGNSEILIENSPGLYISDKITGTEGHTYTLSVDVEGKVYTATSVMPTTVQIENLYIYNIPIGDKDWYSPCVVYYDPPTSINYYMDILYVNRRQSRTPYMFDDEYKDGLLVENILFYAGDNNKDEELRIGDEIKVEMRSITKGAYDYFVSINSIAAGGGTNPISNFSGNVLGCFNIYGVSSKELVIEDSVIFDKKLSNFSRIHINRK